MGQKWHRPNDELLIYWTKVNHLHLGAKNSDIMMSYKIIHLSFGEFTKLGRCFFSGSGDTRRCRHISKDLAVSFSYTFVVCVDDSKSKCDDDDRCCNGIEEVANCGLHIFSDVI